MYLIKENICNTKMVTILHKKYLDFCESQSKLDKTSQKSHEPDS